MPLVGAPAEPQRAHERILHQLVGTAALPVMR
jgi:hypothetical protein